MVLKTSVHDKKPAHLCSTSSQQEYALQEANESVHNKKPKRVCTKSSLSAAVVAEHCAYRRALCMSEGGMLPKRVRHSGKIPLAHALTSFSSDADLIIAQKHIFSSLNPSKLRPDSCCEGARQAWQLRSSNADRWDRRVRVTLQQMRCGNPYFN